MRMIDTKNRMIKIKEKENKKRKKTQNEYFGQSMEPKCTFTTLLTKYPFYAMFNSNRV